MLSKKLHEYLEKWWRYNNHKKYQKYFKLWIDNITDDQIHYYTIEMNRPKDWMENKLNK